MLKRGFSLFCANLSKNVTCKENLKMKSWKIHSYGDLNEMQFNYSRLPVIKSPTEVLVEVKAASLNPIDILMLGGYGRTLFKIPRNFELEFPLTLGRDFSGTVVAKGHDVGNEINIGDEVYGFIPIHKQGSFAEAVIAEKYHEMYLHIYLPIRFAYIGCRQMETTNNKRGICTFPRVMRMTAEKLLPKPKQLSHVESASLVYATMTAWSALFIFGNLFKNTKGLRILVMGASGGVGCSAVQLLKSQQCQVFATCSTDAVPLVQSLGADHVFDYKDPDFTKQVEQEGRYHIILDGAKIGYQNIPKSWQYDTYVTLNSPLLLNTDKRGFICGLTYSVINLLEANLLRKTGGSVKWGFFLPDRKGFEFINKLINSGKIKPILHKTFQFENLPDGMKAMSQGHLRGKVVIDYN